MPIRLEKACCRAGVQALLVLRRLRPASSLAVILRGVSWAGNQMTAARMATS